MKNPEEFRQIIEIAEKKTKGASVLAQTIGVARTTISDAKAGRCGLPDQACEKLARVAEVDFGDVIRARMRQRGFVSISTAIMTAALMNVTLFITHAAESHAGSGFQSIKNNCLQIMRTIR